MAAFCRLRRSLTRLRFLSVILDLYLDAIGLSTTVIGWIFTAALAGGAVVTILITTVADTFGRKQVLILGALLMALAGCVFALTSNPLVLTLAAVFGTISPSGKEVGPFLSIKQAILPQTSQDLYRTKVFSVYNLVGSIFGAFGAHGCGASGGACRFCWHSLGFTQHRCGNRAVIYGTYLVNPVLGLPFLLAGGLKIVYDFWIFAVFRKLRPPEEESGK